MASHAATKDDNTNVADNSSVSVAASAANADRESQRLKLKADTSKYDFVKVRVWLDEHYHVFSRYLVSRILTVTKVSVDFKLYIVV